MNQKQNHTNERVNVPLPPHCSLRSIRYLGACSPTQHMTAIADFDEGVRALLIDKDNQPAWTPPTLEGVSEPTVDALFAEIRHGKPVF